MAEGGEFSGEGRCGSGLLQTRELVFELGSAFSVQVKGSELFEEEVIISEQGGVGFNKTQAPFGRGASEAGEDKGDTCLIVMFAKGNRLHAEVQPAVLEEGREFGCLSIECRRFADFRFLVRSRGWNWHGGVGIRGLRCGNWQGSIGAFSFKSGKTFSKESVLVTKGGKGFCFGHDDVERVAVWVASRTYVWGWRFGFSHHTPTWVLERVEMNLELMDS